MHQFEIAKELGRLASILETKANTAAAKAAEHAKFKHIDDWQKQVQLEKSGRHFAQVCRDAQEKLKSKGGGKSDRCQPPSWEAVLDYTKTAHPTWPANDVQSWFNHFESNGWLVSGKTPMKNWKRAADNGFKHFQEKKGHTGTTRLGATVTATAAGDPEGWADWLKSIKRPYKGYKYEHEFLQKKFHARPK